MSRLPWKLGYKKVLVSLAATGSIAVGFQNCSTGFKSALNESSMAGTSFCASNPNRPECQNVGGAKCSFNGQTYNEGQNVTAYQNSSVAQGQQCVSEIRTCHAGAFSGSYNYANCTPGSLRSCLFNGTTVSSGDSVTAYLSSAPGNGLQCQQETRTCTDGTLSGSYTFPSCDPGQQQACMFNNQSVPHGESVTAYTETTGTCTPQTRTCYNGALTGVGTYASCTPTQQSSCALQGQTVASGSQVKAYQSANVPYGQTCAFEMRTCTNGVLSGSFQNLNCVEGPAATCTFNSQTVANNDSVTAYQSVSVPYNQTCVSQTRTCSNGVLSGTYHAASCTPAAPLNCGFAGRTVAHGESVQAYSSSTVPYGQTCTPITRTCENGVLSHSGNFPTCNPGAGASCTISLPGNFQIIPHEGTITLYTSAAATPTQPCQTQVRTCENGTLTGSATYSSCEGQITFGAQLQYTANGYLWTERQLALGSNFYGVSTVISANGNTLVVASSGKLIASVDAGLTWYPIPSSYYFTSLNASLDASTLVATVSGVNSIYISHDTGRSWVKSPVVDPNVNNGFDRIAVSSDAQKIVLGPYSPSGQNGVAYLSNDGGGTWKKLDNIVSFADLIVDSYGAPVPLKLQAFTMSRDGNTIVVSYSGYAPHVSRDGGSTWQKSGVPDNYGWFVVSADGKKILTQIANSHTYKVSSDSGVTWSTPSEWWSVFGLPLMSSDGSKLIIEKDSLLQFSTNDGRTWSPLTIPNNLGEQSWGTLSATPDLNRLFAFVRPGSLLTAEISSQSISFPATGAQFTEITNYPRSSSYDKPCSVSISGTNGLTVTTSGSPAKHASSSDRGATWNSPTTFPLSAFSKAKSLVSADGSTTLFAADGITVTTNTATAQVFYTSLGGSRGDLSLMASRTGSTLVATVTNGLGANSDFVSSIDRGTHWVAKHGPSQFYGWIGMIMSPDSGALYGSIASQLMKSTDVGTSWTKVLDGPYGGGLAQAKNGTQIGFASREGLALSMDSGATWTNLALPFTPVGFSILSFSDDGNVAAVASNDFEFIYLSLDRGQTWTRQSAAGRYQWKSVSVSADGKWMAAMTANGRIVTAPTGY